MGSNLSIAAGETRGQDDTHMISHDPEAGRTMSGLLNIVPAYGIFSPNC
ncbi:hypothetical protein [Algoriphagus boritolerans]|nr:hypothetical protein [Algoriphagus boritolerans]